jgi:hypothetical protein
MKLVAPFNIWTMTFLASIPSLASAQASNSVAHCEDHPKVVEACFTFQGRLRQWNGSPTIRIERIGTSRILGVSDGMSLPEYWQIPENVRTALTSFNSVVVADFEFCPFTEEEPGVMRLGCVESATNLQVTANEP